MVVGRLLVTDSWRSLMRIASLERDDLWRKREQDEQSHEKRAHDALLLLI